ncbi:lanthionine synthetase LanC family protein [Streptomyces sp. KLOTTS4A1]|uniref:lanthionine synthetase LanC family protein n=1 Tax=Streptomyces sp. KLOTTS4A1 TaxID=3390996 RepID=UPI0039F53F4C
MKAADPFVLRPDVDVVPVRDLPDDIRGRLDDDDAYAVTRRYSRTPSSLVDADTAALIGLFRQPATIVEAILRYSLPRGADPGTVLDESLPVLSRLIAVHDLVPPDTDLAAAVGATLETGDVVHGFSVIRCVHLVEDTEVYEVSGAGTRAALKLARAPKSPAAAALRREARVLELLDAKVSPRCLGSGLLDGRPYLVTAWCPGVDSETAARALRERSTGEDRPGLLALVRAVARAFARVHEAGVVHGDVHPNNVLVDATGSGEITIIDFGLAAVPGDGPAALPGGERGDEREGGPGDVPGGEPGGEPGAAPRGGIGPFLDPGYVTAALESRPPPPVSAAAEQYSLAALLYYLVSGTPYREFSLERREMFRQIAEDPPLPFARRGVAPWPGLENVLRRALRKEPGERFPSLTRLADALDGVSADTGSTWDFLRTETGRRREVVLREFTADLDIGGAARAQDLAGPSASLNYGAAGISYGLYRMALAGQSPSLLASADYWSLRALHQMDRPDAFANPELDITPETVGAVSPFHTVSGVHAVRALLDHAGLDPTAEDSGVRSFAAAVQAPCDSADLTLGRAGALLAAALLLEATRNPAAEAAGSALRPELVAELEHPAAMGDESAPWRYLGIAHGWAGALYALLRWCQATRSPVPGVVHDRLDELYALARRDGDRLRWPVSAAPETEDVSMQGWCHGSAGHAFLWTLAAEVTGRARLLDVAVGAARSALVGGGTDRSLCCGLAGRAYSLLALYRATGDDVWLDGAWALAAYALRAPGPSRAQRLSLYKGDLGLMVLLADLAAPHHAAMPFFEPEGWPAADGPASPC